MVDLIPNYRSSQPPVSRNNIKFYIKIQWLSVKSPLSYAWCLIHSFIHSLKFIYNLLDFFIYPRVLGLICRFLPWFCVPHPSVNLLIKKFPFGLKSNLVPGLPPLRNWSSVLSPRPVARAQLFVDIVSRGWMLASLVSGLHWAQIWSARSRATHCPGSF